MNLLKLFYILFLSCFLNFNLDRGLNVKSLSLKINKAFASRSYFSPENFEQESSKYKLAVFLSEKCPCSRSHIRHVKDLMLQYPDLKVYGVISEPAQTAKEQKLKDDYFLKKDFGFPIINDPGQILVKKYQALKTPHVTLLAKKTEGSFQIVYEGGLTDSKQFTASSKKYLEEGLKNLAKGEDVKVKNGFCLGCHIKRF